MKFTCKIIDYFKLILKNIIKNVIAKILIRFEFLDVLIKYGKGIGWNSPLKSEVEFLVGKNKDPFILFDIGANIGNYSKIVTELYPQSYVYSFEPSKITFEMLSKNLEKFDNVKPIQLAFGDTKKKMNLYSNFAGSGMASLNKRNLSNSEIIFSRSEIVNVLTLDDWSATNDIFPDYIKIDVEGFELSVLKGAVKTLQKVKAVQFEFGGTVIDPNNYFRDYWNFFEKLNFSMFRYTPFGLLELKHYSEKEELFEYMNYIAFPPKNI